MFPSANSTKSAAHDLVEDPMTPCNLSFKLLTRRLVQVQHNQYVPKLRGTND